MSTSETLPPNADEIVALLENAVNVANKNKSVSAVLPVEHVLRTSSMVYSLRTRLAEVEKELAWFRNAPVQEQKLCGRFGLKSYLDLENEVSHLGTSLAETRIELAQLKEANAELVKLLEVERKSK